LDTNIITYSLNRSMPEHSRSRQFLEELTRREDVALCEQVLIEVYLLTRNPTVFPHPYSAPEAAAVCERYRASPTWRLIECMPVMQEVWKQAAQPTFARRRIIDVRLALTLRAGGVTEFATRNTADFAGLGFQRVWDPLAEPAATARVPERPPRST